MFGRMQQAAQEADWQLSWCPRENKDTVRKRKRKRKRKG
jgi:hypothetical protein